MKLKWDMKKIIISLVILLLLLIIPLFSLGENIAGFFMEKYHNFQLKRVEEISIKDDVLMGNTINNINNNGLVGETEDYYYYLKGMQIYRSDKEFSNEEILVDKPFNPGKDNINLVEDWLFYRQASKLNRKDLKTGKIRTIYRGYSSRIHVLGNWIYLVNLDDYKLYRVDVNGQNKEIISDREIFSMIIDEEKIYYNYEEKGKYFLERMNLDGSKSEFLANIEARNMVMGDGYLYYIDMDTDKLSRFSFEDSTIESLLDKSVFSFVKDDDYIFFCLKEEKEDYFEHKGLYRIDIDGENETIIDSESYIDFGGLGLTDDWVFYDVIHGTEPYDLKRLDKDGRQIIDMGSYE